jgi:uncharacterized protein (TIGR03435 family)
MTRLRLHFLIPSLCLILSSLVHGQDQPARLTFEVASIKPSQGGGRGGGIKPMPGGQGYLAQGVPVKLMISLMYKVPMRQITGGPAWFETDPFDVEAKADHPYSLDDLHVMFQNLLADEFKLKFHKEKKEGNVYALMIDKKGLKMKVNESPQDFNIPIQGGRGGVLIGTRVPMNYLAWTLGQAMQRDGRPVIDLTGLEGNYDFTLSFAPEIPPDFPTENLPPGLLERPTIFEALKQQLGLRLEAQKGPVEYYVIDHLEKPAAN